MVVTGSVLGSARLRIYTGMDSAPAGIKRPIHLIHFIYSFLHFPIDHATQCLRRAIIMTFATEDLSIQPGVLRTPKSGYNVAQKPCATFLPTPISEKSSRGVLSVLDSNKISWMSPASTVSTTSSPAGFNDMWDLPETPTKRTTSASPRSILTPFTPPTPPDSSKKLLFTPIPKPFFGVGVTPAIPKPFFQEKETAAQDDPFQPKLFRGVTLVLEESTSRHLEANSDHI